MSPPTFRFARDHQELRTQLFLKQQCCPHCGRAGTLNRHSRLAGNDPTSTDAQRQRGQRAFCSNRGQRCGCGRTFSWFLADTLPRHTMTAALLWKLLCQLLAGRSLRAVAHALRLPFALETLYRLRQRLRAPLDLLRVGLCRSQPAPPSTQAEPVLQTVEHFQIAFPTSNCPLADFQRDFQQPVFG